MDSKYKGLHPQAGEITVISHASIKCVGFPLMFLNMKKDKQDINLIRVTMSIEGSILEIV